MCLVCPSSVGGQDPGQFVTLPFKTWTKMCAKAYYAITEYQQSATSAMRDFIARYVYPSLSVATEGNGEQLQGDRVSIQGSHSLWKQDLAMSGHRDDIVQWEDRGDNTKEGNFI